ncbi:hypothetical protein KJ807_05645 [Patescibacteria group bacterium]|nr:hypothetical protein [Patescibacteria group bacterium]
MSNGIAVDLPIIGNTGISMLDIYAAVATAGLSSFVLGGGYIVPTGMSFQQTLMTVGLVIGSHLVMKQLLAKTVLK